MAENTTNHSAESQGVELPMPTAWPMLFALGVTLLFSGLVTNVVVTLVGAALFVRGAIGWWFDVLPHEQHEIVPLQPESERPPAIVPQTAAVEHLRLADSGHRVRLPLEMQPYSSGFRGGIAGAAAMAVVAVAYGLIAEGSIWYPINLLASAVLPSMNVADAEELRAFNGLALLAATFMHLGLSLLVGLVYAVLLPTLPGRSMLWGGFVAPIAWSSVAWASLGIVAPALNEHINWGWFVASQAAFGLVAGYVIQQIEPIAILQRAPFAARAGVEAAGVSHAHPSQEDSDE